MAKKANASPFVITYETDLFGRRYYGTDGKPTSLIQAAEFSTHVKAEQFAAAHGLTIGGSVNIMFKTLASIPIAPWIRRSTR